MSAWKPAKPQLPGYRPDLSPAKADYARALELIHNSKRPIILAGHGILVSGAEREVMQFAEKANVPVAMTLLGLGGFPAQHPLNLGMMGMHGEAWVNQAIQESDLLLAFGEGLADDVAHAEALQRNSGEQVILEMGTNGHHYCLERGDIDGAQGLLVGRIEGYDLRDLIGETLDDLGVPVDA